ncbi:S15/NS1 RNA-binding domain-containing protein [Daedaleopsis nitida]|nr:S15/NS1 RNA-binding domain-containing protein [Daedaleopsis nitida]
MLGAQLAQCSRPLASSSSARAASLHTSAVLQAVSTRTRKSLRTLKANVQRREELQRQAQQNRPHVVLGHKAGDEAKWLNSDLARVLVTAEDVRATPQPSMDAKTKELQTATYFNYGIGEKEKEVLFEVLPRLSAEGKILDKGWTNPIDLAQTEAEREKLELKKGVLFAKLADLRNANARGIAYENRRRIVAAFSEPANPTDTGRPEVQAALATMRIRNVWDHLSNCKKDIANRRSLRRLIHQRAKILRYLKSVDEDRYDRILERLGLERSAVEGELVV